MLKIFSKKLHNFKPKIIFSINKKIKSNGKLIQLFKNLSKKKKTLLQIKIL